MRNAAHQTRANRTITIDFHNEATYGQLLGDGKAFIPSLKTIVHALWNRIESQSVIRWSFDACI